MILLVVIISVAVVAVVVDLRVRDYRGRRLTEARKLIDELIDERESSPVIPPPMPSGIGNVGRAPVPRLPPPAPTVKQLRRMASWDRKDLEIDRAIRGLPPVDDLEGMASWDIRDVLKARAKYGTDV